MARWSCSRARWAHPCDVGRPRGRPGRRPSRAPLRPPRSRGIGGAAGAVLDGRAVPRRARPAGRGRRAVRLVLRAVAGRLRRPVAGCKRAGADRPAGAGVHVAQLRRLRRAWRERAAAVRAGGTEAVVDAVLARWFTAGVLRPASGCDCRLAPASSFRSPTRDTRAAARHWRAGNSTIRAAADRSADAGRRRATPTRRRRSDVGTGDGRGRARLPAGGARARRSPGAHRAARGVHPRAARTPRSERRTMSDELYDRGMEVRREVHGDAHVDAATGTQPTSPATSRSSSRATRGEASGRDPGSTAVHEACS